MIIGGGRLYREAVNYAARLLVTKVDTVVKDAQVFFPSFEDAFKLVGREDFKADEQNDFDYSFCVYERK
jgi:dihydrofolate reductase